MENKSGIIEQRFDLNNDFDGGFGQDNNYLEDDGCGSLIEGGYNMVEDDMMIMDDDEVEVVTGNVVSPPFEEIKCEMEEGRALNLIVYDQQRGK